MSREEYEAFEKALMKRGYNKYNSTVNHCDFYLSKSFGQSTYSSDSRSNYLVLFCIFDFNNFATRTPHFEREPFSVSPYIMVSRTVDERVDLHLPCFGAMPDVDDVEKKAESFFKWVEANIKVEEEGE